MNERRICRGRGLSGRILRDDCHRPLRCTYGVMRVVGAGFARPLFAEAARNNYKIYILEGDTYGFIRP